MYRGLPIFNIADGIIYVIYTNYLKLTPRCKIFSFTRDTAKGSKWVHSPTFISTERNKRKNLLIRFINILQCPKRMSWLLIATLAGLVWELLFRTPSSRIINQWWISTPRLKIGRWSSNPPSINSSLSTWVLWGTSSWWGTQFTAIYSQNWRNTMIRCPRTGAEVSFRINSMLSFIRLWKSASQKPCPNVKFCWKKLTHGLNSI